MPAALKSICPVFSTLDVPALLDHYKTLGFTTTCHSDPSTLPGQVEYGFAERDGLVIHIAYNPEHEPATTAGCCFVHVSDADALAAEWKGTAGRNVEPVDTTYNMREGGHVDPDGNLIRYGSRTRTT